MSYLQEKTKLDVIKYNKCFQNKLSLNIDQYKKKSGKYIINEVNNSKKEYILYTNKLIFEGEYLNGKKNGKGKEYDYYGSLKFEGNYINGKRNGKGKEYINILEDKLIFEGEYLNGKRNGKGKEYQYIYSKCCLKFEGDYLNGKIWNGKGYNSEGNIIFEINNGIGYIKEYNRFKELIFEGEYVNGEKNGKGKEYDKSNGKVIFEGEYLNGKRWNGIGYKYDKNKTYVIKNGKGCVKEYEDDKLVFTGEYINGEKNGKGKEYKIKYTLGRFRVDYDEYQEYTDKSYYLIYEGEYLNGKRNGQGKEYDDYYHITYIGEFLNGKRNGKGKVYDSKNKLIFEGEFLNGIKYKGKEYNDKGILIFEGEYGEFSGEKKW